MNSDISVLPRPNKRARAPRPRRKRKPRRPPKGNSAEFAGAGSLECLASYSGSVSGWVNRSWQIRHERFRLATSIGDFRKAST